MCIRDSINAEYMGMVFLTVILPLETRLTQAVVLVLLLAINFVLQVYGKPYIDERINKLVIVGFSMLIVTLAACGVIMTAPRNQTLVYLGIAVILSINIWWVAQVYMVMRAELIFRVNKISGDVKKLLLEVREFWNRKKNTERQLEMIHDVLIQLASYQRHDSIKFMH
eukprot:TRINITY_DN6555_c0_g2_i3.p1 TRINITY_DN6555_c0_g2~~TRINITY_DN6555_c0_g2_i3.p1  ORF type:complete len:168 (-),score=9.24 TRINITY_DN6555_c0_g2_i3:237-740(-)